MNHKILNQEVQDYINKNINTEITRLILKGSPFEEISIQEIAEQIESKKRCSNKLSTWYNTPNIYFPNKLNIEQTSSEITAKYKSSIIKGSSIIDITGGFGVDCYYFSKGFQEVLHCEINEGLSRIVTHNYKVLNVSNIKTISGNGFDYLKSTKDTFDCIYIDPSRRNEIKGKVFLLKDCLPYVPPKIEFFFSKAKQILIKVSPMLDITSTLKELKHVKEIHVVAVQNEVKELLFLLDKNYEGAIQMKTINFNKNEVQTFNFELKQKAKSYYELPQAYLYEPNAAILKSGGFHQIPEVYHVCKLSHHSHLYTSDILVDFPGRKFKVDQVISYDKKKIKKELKDRKANITTRNFPKTVAQIRKETKLKDGGNSYLFFTTNKFGKLTVIFCSKL